MGISTSRSGKKGYCALTLVVLRAGIFYLSEVDCGAKGDCFVLLSRSIKDVVAGLDSRRSTSYAWTLLGRLRPHFEAPK